MGFKVTRYSFLNIGNNIYRLGVLPHKLHISAVAAATIESLGNTTATSVKTCSITIAFLLEDKGDHKLYIVCIKKISFYSVYKKKASL